MSRTSNNIYVPKCTAFILSVVLLLYKLYIVQKLTIYSWDLNYILFESWMFIVWKVLFLCYVSRFLSLVLEKMSVRSENLTFCNLFVLIYCCLSELLCVFLWQVRLFICIKKNETIHEHSLHNSYSHLVFLTAYIMIKPQYAVLCVCMQQRNKSLFLYTNYIAVVLSFIVVL